MTHHFQIEQWVPVPVEKVFLFFADPQNLPRIMPATSGTELVRIKLVAPGPEPTAAPNRQAVAGAGSEIVASFRVVSFLPVRARWEALITEFEWNHYFEDMQKEGPFKSFVHRHELFLESRQGVAGTLVRDAIAYEVGFGWLGELADKIFIRHQLQKLFEHRQQALPGLLGCR